MVGLETLPYTFLLLVSVILSARAINEPGSGTYSRSSGLAILWMLLILTRPEGALAIISVWLIVLISRLRKNRLNLTAITRSTLVFIILTAIYLGWKIWFFGNLLPNPFFIKSSGIGLSQLGLGSVFTFIKMYKEIICIALAVIALVFGTKTKPIVKTNTRDDKYLLLIASVTALLNIIFFARTDTLMDISGRFLFPLVPVFILIAAPLIQLGSRSLLNVRSLMLPISITSLFFAIFFLSGTNWDTIRHAYSVTAFSDIADTERFQIENNQQLELANKLSEFPYIKDTKIAYGDAGILPFITQAPWLDPVGLNDTYLAQSKDLNDSVNYFFDQNPDLVLMPVTDSNIPIEYGHGLLGNYLAWEKDERWNDYRTLGTLKRTDTSYWLEFRVRKSSPLSNEISEFTLNEILQN